MNICMSTMRSRIGAPLLVAVVVTAVAIFAVAEEEALQWQILTKSNYTEQIRLNPSLLLLVTVPWSGESRHLMKELASAVSRNRARVGDMKLTVLHRNAERVLADALGATDGITVFYYRNAVSYKYSGRLRVENILSSVEYVASLSPDVLPLRSITTPDELRDFVDSTDKAVVLFDSCGWTLGLLALDKRMTERGFGYDITSANKRSYIAGLFPHNDQPDGCVHADFSRESNGTVAAEENDNEKGLGNDELSCGVDGFSTMLQSSKFTSVNDSLMKAAPTFAVGDSCSLDELQKFKLFFQKFIPIVREFFLPHDRRRFALVRERPLLPLLNIVEQSPWFVAVSCAACTGAGSSKVLKEIDDLRTALQNQASLVLELDDDLHGAEATLPAKRPSLLLFVDRSSNSTQIMKESQMALKAFRELAEYYKIENQVYGKVHWPEKTPTETDQALSSALKRSRFQPFPASKKLILKDKMSIMIMNEGQQITLENLVPDLQGNSMHEIISYALKRKKELTLSSLVKDTGFQLLSKDFDVEVVESLPQSSEVVSNQVLREPPAEDGLGNAVDLDEQVPAVSFSGENVELPNPSDAEHIQLKGNRDFLDKSSEPYLESELLRHTMSIHTDKAQGSNEERRPSEIDENELQKIFTGSLFFLDGQYRLLEALTGSPRMPSVVIVDPISQQHYVSNESVFNYSGLNAFVSGFLAGKLSPYQQSAPVVPDARTIPRPPFVNLDFNEMDSIPQVTTHTFSELVLGHISDSKNSAGSWNKNVLVLFSSSWCGFCQRMELVVREVYRAVNTYTNRKMHSSWKEKGTLTEYVEDAELKLPLIYMMDCTQNDCSLIIKSTQQSERYPLLLLFPAEMKNNTVTYEGDIAVSDIIKFLAAHGCNVLDLIMDKSFLEDRSSVKQGPQSRNLPHEILLKDRSQNTVVTHHQITSHFPVGLHERPELFVGCFLSATEKLLDVHPFDESKILIVKVDQGTGFQGLIINKQITWDSFEELEEGFDLLKEAPLSFGGPVVRRGMPLVALTRKSSEDKSHEVRPNTYFFDPVVTHNLLEGIREGNLSVHDYWFFLGYSSWGWDQLFYEISQGAWSVSEGNLEELEWPSR